MKVTVASFTDAWIETVMAGNMVTIRLVASFTDAWIETVGSYSTLKITAVASFTDAWIETSFPTPFAPHNNVASFTDAWIETGTYVVNSIPDESHLLQMRGLKPVGARKGTFAKGRIFYRCVD